MITDDGKHGSGTDRTDGTIATHVDIHVRACAYMKTMPQNGSIGSGSELVGGAALPHRVADFVDSLPVDGRPVMTIPDKYVREAVRLGFVKREKLAPGIYRFSRVLP